MEIKFTIPGEVTAQGRPKVSARGKFVTVYDPKKSKDYKTYVAQIASQYRPLELIEGPIYFRLTIYRQIPKSFSKKKQEMALEGKILPTQKPDCSNYVKGIEDALNGLIWHDDSQIVLLLVAKRYSEDPRAEVTITEIE